MKLAAFQVVLPIVMMLALPADDVAAQTVDVSGHWALEVTTDGGVTTPSLVLEQDGAMLTGHYTSATLGDTDVTGTVTDRTVRVSFEASMGGGEFAVVYEGDIDDEGRWSGTIDIAGGMLTGSFVGTKR